jgi:hypothetical protein
LIFDRFWGTIGFDGVEKNTNASVEWVRIHQKIDSLTLSSFFCQFFCFIQYANFKKMAPLTVKNNGQNSNPIFPTNNYVLLLFPIISCKIYFI